MPQTSGNKGGVLAVGSSEAWSRQTSQSLDSDTVSFVEFREVTGELLDLIQPDTVVSPALARDFDCIDLALLLNAAGYGGSYRAFAADLPKPGLIEAEIAQLCPRLDFAIVTEL